MTAARALFYARISLVLSFAGMVSTFVPIVMSIWKPRVFSTRWTMFTPIGIVLTWGSICISAMLTRRQLLKALEENVALQERLIKALNENIALQEGQARLRLGEPGDHDRKGILT